MPMTLRNMYRHCCDLLPRNMHNRIGSEFGAINDNRGRVEYVLELIREYRLLSELSCELAENSAVKYAAKCNMKSEKYREEAKTQSGYMTLELVNQAVGAAPAKSEELGNALLERSQILCELGRIKLAMTDLENVLNCQNINESSVRAQIEDLKRKLEQQNEARYNTCDNPIPPSLSFKLNAKIACAGDCIEMRHTEEKGRHIVATTAIKAGDVIAVEAPYATLTSNYLIGRCHLCVRLIYAPLPCDSCTEAFYCSEECKLNAWNSYHKYECPIAGILKYMEVERLHRMALRISFMAVPEYQELQFYHEDDFERYESDKYKEIHHLCANTERRAVADLFSRAIYAAVLFTFVADHTTFLADGHDAGVFQELLLRHIQTAATNYHEITERCINRETKCHTIVEAGAGAYSFHSLLNHSCAPNVVRYCYGAKLALFALSDIDKGEELYDNYGYHYAVTPKAIRQEQLKSQYLFDCSCAACLFNWPEYGYLPPLPGLPDVCEEDFETVERADREELTDLQHDLFSRVHALKDHPMSANMASIHETVKECLSLLANKRYL